MEITTKTKSGLPVRLTIERDKYSIHQIYACFTPSNENSEERLLCEAWRVRKTQQGIEEGIVAKGLMIQVPKRDWERMLLLREDLRDKENLKDIQLIKVFSKGNIVTVDGYTLSARVDGKTWEKIEPFMHRVDSSVNDEILSGDHFIGWVVKEGMETMVEHTLGVRKENLIFAKPSEDIDNKA